MFVNFYLYFSELFPDTGSAPLPAALLESGAAPAAIAGTELTSSEGAAACAR